MANGVHLTDVQPCNGTKQGAKQGVPGCFVTLLNVLAKQRPMRCINLIRGNFSREVPLVVEGNKQFPPLRQGWQIDFE
ncbi:hypothetical protein CEXT_629151 [Caerostris extrusa]|uniref:Uncharacterized protein n=1 Tax=Caerostris extrusa TaxID=172846 RepID=A0AAV4VMY8_CAEEX|nr:hypothetical protein CEXT_629151 [Caerostris extrusa]